MKYFVLALCLFLLYACSTTGTKSSNTNSDLPSTQSTIITPQKSTVIDQPKATIDCQKPNIANSQTQLNEYHQQSEHETDCLIKASRENRKEMQKWKSKAKPMVGAEIK